MKDALTLPIYIIVLNITWVTYLQRIFTHAQQLHNFPRKNREKRQGDAFPEKRKEVEFEGKKIIQPAPL